MIKGKYLSEQNINNYLRKYTNHSKGFNHEFYENKEVIKFYTKSYFLDENKIYELEEFGLQKALEKFMIFMKRLIK